MGAINGLFVRYIDLEEFSSWLVLKVFTFVNHIR